MDERKLTSSNTKISSSCLGELQVDDPDFSVESCSQNVLLLRKVEELYDKLQKQLQECIRLKTENQRLKAAQANRDKQESSLFEQNDRALFGMFMEKIAQLEEENKQLKADKENSMSSSVFSKQRSQLIFSPKGRNSNIPRIPTSPMRFSKANNSSRDEAPTTRQLLRVTSSIEQMWQGAQSPSQSLLYRSK